MKSSLLAIFMLSIISAASQASVVPDRQRLFFDGNNSVFPVRLENYDKQRTMLVKASLNDESMKSVKGTLLLQPSIMRFEPGEKRTMFVRKIGALPEHKESVFYYTLTNIPPVNDEKKSALEIVLASRLKAYYRPAAVMAYAEKSKKGNTPWQHMLGVSRKANTIILDNPSPLYVNILNIKYSGDKKTKPVSVMAKPLDKTHLSLGTPPLTSTLEITYIDDSGKVNIMQYSCHENKCTRNDI